MSERTHWLTRFASNLHAELRDLCDAFGTVLVDTFHYLALFALGATTVWSAIAAFLGMVHRGRAELGDLLLLFIYLEIGAMGWNLLQNNKAASTLPDLYCYHRFGARSYRTR
jgi:protein PsiE